MKSKPQFHEIGSTVLVRRVARGKGKVQGTLWAHVAKIVEVFRDKYLYRIVWLTQGPTLEDAPGTTATRRYHQRSLKALPPGVSIHKLSSMQLKEDEYEVDAILGFKFENNEKHFLVLWSGYPPSSATWEPR
jgi:Chromo (CHRromatin Organisation MOdifier) domain